ncbi:MAG: hypothetical protein ACOX47_06045 [Bacillota bacterium]
MKLRKALLILIILVSVSSGILSSTLARFTDELAGFDSALVAKWNFSARGEDDEPGEFYNKGFTFDLFRMDNEKSLEPMDVGVKSFTFTGGGSDVGILYNVEMNAKDFLEPIPGTVATDNAVVYAPFIFKIAVSINDGAGDTPPEVFPFQDDADSGWFRPKDIDTDEDGFFPIFNEDSYFSPGSIDQVTVTVYWQWNTSFYINDLKPDWADPDTSKVAGEKYLHYYQVAYDEYYGPGGLDAQRKEAAEAVRDYLREHGSPSDDHTWIHYIRCKANHGAEYAAIEDPEAKEAYFNEHGGSFDTEDNIIWEYHEVPCPANHFAEYNHLVDEEHDAIEACETSLMAAYDDYDTLAADALAEKESVKVIFRIRGEQMKPQ